MSKKIPSKPPRTDSLAMALLDAGNQQQQKAAEEANTKDDDFNLRLDFQHFIAEEATKLKRLNLTYEDLLQRAAESAALADLAEEAYFFTKDRLAECRLASHENGLTLAKEVKSLGERLKHGRYELLLAHQKEVQWTFNHGVELQKKTHAKNAANALHSKPGGSRDKAQQIRDIWASGKYSSRDICAEQECAALGMSFSAARKALRNTPEPT